MKVLITMFSDRYRFLHNPKKTNVAQVCVTSSIFSMFKMFFVFIPVVDGSLVGSFALVSVHLKTAFLYRPTVDVNVS